MIFSDRFRSAIAGLIFAIWPLVALTGCSSADVKSVALGGEWQLAGAPAGVPAQTISFLEPGRVSGHGGCNRYSGAIESDGTGSLRIGPVAATKMACLDEVRMHAESRYFAILEQVRGYAFVNDDHLRLLGENGQILIEFLRMADR